MKNSPIFLIIALFVILTSISYLEASCLVPPKEKTKLGELPSMLQIGGNYTHVNIDPDTTSNFHGNLGGLQAMYEYRPSNFVYAAIKGMWRQGNTDGHDATRFFVDVDAHERLGYTFATKSQFYLLTPFTGIGYRYFSHHLHNNGSSLRLNYNEFYVPLGVLQDFRINDTFSIGAYFTWMPQVNSTVGLTPLSGAQWSLENRLANFLVELPLNFSMGSMKQFLVIFKPFYEYWQDGQSTAVLARGSPLGIPGNTYNFWGAELNFGYRF